MSDFGLEEPVWPRPFRVTMNFEDSCISNQRCKPLELKAGAAATAAKSLQLCSTLCDPIDGSPPGSPIPGITPGKNAGVGCHFLLQCMKMKSESKVAQSYLTLSDPMDYGLPGPPSMGLPCDIYKEIRCSGTIFLERTLSWPGIKAFSLGSDNILEILLQAAGFRSCWKNSLGLSSW